LQNYWMVIHPPVLFMGFASVIVPFAFAIAGLWKKNYGEWTKPALPWALFSAAVFGVGIMMGAMWAYESLTFGGYWAWDPVENASLVPWMVLVSGIHTLLIYKHTGHSLRSTHLFFILAFGLVLYSTFLTRSGVLGETSVHAFTDLGMNWQLLSFLLIFVLPSLAFFFIRFSSIPSIKKEESGSSREFWMFIGSLVLFLSAMLIIAKTSLPVYNKIFGASKAPPEDPEFSYNRIQIFVAIIIGTLTAIGQYLKYKSTATNFFLKKLLVPTLIAAVIATLILVFGKVNYEKKSVGFMAAIWVAVASSVYAIIANAAYIWIGLKGKLKLSGGSIAHLGFGMVLLGILISSSKKEVLSNNINGIFIPLGPNEDPRENLTLPLGAKMSMGKYDLTFLKDSLVAKEEKTYFKILFENKNGKERFVLKPNSYINPDGNEGLMSNPDSRKYWDHDVFTYITSLPDPSKQKDTASFQSHLLGIGDSVFYSNGFIIVDTVRKQEDVPANIAAIMGPEGGLYDATIKVYSKTGSIHTISPKLVIAKNEFIALPDTLVAEGLVFKLQNVRFDDPGKINGADLHIKESDAVLKYVTLKAYKFPFINLLWLGVIITATGIIISMVRRIRLNRNSPSNS